LCESWQPLRDTAECLAEVSAATNEGNAERVLLDVVGMVCGRQDFRFVNIVYSNGFKDLSKIPKLAREVCGK
jgi:hypothetical protein